MVRVIPMSQLGMRPDNVVDPSQGSPDLEPEEEHEPEYRLFEGPKYTFSLLLGASRTWIGGPAGGAEPRDTGAVCRDCGRSVVVARVRQRLADGTRQDVAVVRPGLLPSDPLPAYAYCLTCDRCGKDAVIPPGEPRPEKGRKVYAPADGLKGGVG